MFVIDVSVLVHVVNLERLTANGARCDVIVITAEENGLSGEL